MSLEERLLVPLAKSRRSSSATDSPRNAASRATPAPVMPPPITIMSKCCSARSRRFLARERKENSAGRAINPAHLLTRSSGLSTSRNAVQHACDHVHPCGRERALNVGSSRNSLRKLIAESQRRGKRFYKSFHHRVAFTRFLFAIDHQSLLPARARRGRVS